MRNAELMPLVGSSGRTYQTQPVAIHGYPKRPLPQDLGGKAKPRPAFGSAAPRGLLGDKEKPKPEPSPTFTATVVPLTRAL